MKYLFLFSITPVQEFIKQARKTQDLYAGSFILSHLCRTAAKKAEQDYKARIVFPVLTNKAIINRFLAVVNDSDTSKNLDMGRQIEHSVRKEFWQMAETIFNNMKILEPPGFREQFDKQINNYWHCYWVFEEFPNNQFAQSYKKIEQSFGAIKNTRIFKQLEQEPARKCSITGEHNVLFYRTGQKKNFVPNFAAPVSQKIPLKLLDSKEKLGGITFVKRCAEKYFEPSSYIADFPSTADIALMATLEDFRGEIPKTGVNSAALLDRSNGKPMPEGLDGETKENTNKAFGVLRTNKVKLTPYYALVLFDGDNMGRWLAGDFINEKANLEDFQNHLSSQLGQFSNLAQKEIVTPPIGKTVYAGGDDFLGFINTTHLFETLKELCNEFAQINLGEFTSFKPTFSAGIVVAHWKSPLEEVLGWARRMEKEAKNIDGDKNAFALAILKRSGEIHKAIYKWLYDDNWTVDILKDLITRIKETVNNPSGQEFSSNFIKTLNQEFQKIMDDDGNLFHEGLIKSEIKRLLQRSYLPGKKPGETSQEFKLRKELAVQSLLVTLKTLYKCNINLQNFLSTLNIADFLAREA